MQFNVTNGCDEQNKLKNSDGDPTHTLLVYCIYYGRVVAHENDATSYPFVCPQRYSEENCEHFFPVDMLCAMSPIQMTEKALSSHIPSMPFVPLASV